MTKQELIKTIRDRTGIESPVVVRVVETLMNVIGESLSDGESVILRGFGSFQVKHRATKVARDMSKGVPIEIPAHYVPIFKPSKALTDKVKKCKVTKEK